jgi:hypothetical protein
LTLLTEEIRRLLPPLYATEHLQPEEKVIIAKVLDPCGAYT